MSKNSKGSLSQSNRELGRLYEAGDIIFSQGDVANCMYIIQKGEVEMVLETSDSETRLQLLKKEDVFGEVALFADRAQFVTARAMEQSRVLTIDRKSFFAKLHQDSSLAFRIIQQMAQHIYELDHQLMQRSFETPAREKNNVDVPKYPNADELLDEEVERAKKLLQSMAFAVIDVDDFKAIRKKYGLPAGKLVMKSLAAILAKDLRRTDIIGRFGKDRFGIILYEASGPAAVRVVEKVRKAFSRTRFKSSGSKFNATFSCGIAVLPEFDSAVGLRDAANKALDKGKKNGCNRVILAEPEADISFDDGGRPIGHVGLPSSVFSSSDES